jgi:hypothetical protein
VDDNHKALLTDFGMAYAPRDSYVAISKSISMHSGGTRGYLVCYAPVPEKLPAQCLYAPTGPRNSQNGCKLQP